MNFKDNNDSKMVWEKKVMCAIAKKLIEGVKEIDFQSIPDDDLIKALRALCDSLVAAVMNHLDHLTIKTFQKYTNKE